MSLQMRPAFFLRVLSQKFFSKIMQVGGAAYTRVQLIHECLRYTGSFTAAMATVLPFTARSAIWEAVS